MWIYNLADLSHFYGRAMAPAAMLCLGKLAKNEQPPPEIYGPLMEKTRDILAVANARRAFRGMDTLKANPMPGCALSHPDTTSCTGATLDFATRCFPKAFKMYLPLNIGTALIFKWKTLMKEYVLSCI